MNIYTCPTNLEIVRIGNEWLVVDTDNFTVTMVNETGADILKVLKQPKDIKAVVEPIQSQYDVDVNDLESDVMAYIEELKGVGLIANANTESFNHRSSLLASEKRLD
jgi:hypothetical protein